MTNNIECIDGKKLDEIFNKLVNKSLEEFRSMQDELEKSGYNIIPSGAIPIPWFGNHKEYFNPKYINHRALTISLNPSHLEFPALPSPNLKESKKFDNESLKEEIIRSCDTYFDNNPTQWFHRGYLKVFDKLAENDGNGNPVNIEYATNENDTDWIALHTDYCTDIATNPTWSNLRRIEHNDEDKEEHLQRKLKKSYGNIFSEMFKLLEPDVVFVSIAKREYVSMLKQLNISFDESLNVYNTQKFLVPVNNEGKVKEIQFYWGRNSSAGPFSISNHFPKFIGQVRQDLNKK